MAQYRSMPINTNQKCYWFQCQSMSIFANKCWLIGNDWHWEVSQINAWILSVLIGTDLYWAKIQGVLFNPKVGLLTENVFASVYVLIQLIILYRDRYLCDAFLEIRDIYWTCVSCVPSIKIHHLWEEAGKVQEMRWLLNFVMLCHNMLLIHLTTKHQSCFLEW